MGDIRPLAAQRSGAQLTAGTVQRQLPAQAQLAGAGDGPARPAGGGGTIGTMKPR
jgi:hypothetical protein